ncbi:hypothetical protein GOP47_0020567 [Adiantum capillus-veneris]|nr:hypothetical protein GOP47_0020567 [Adiantum capillus-veneris]
MMAAAHSVGGYTASRAFTEKACSPWRMSGSTWVWMSKKRWRCMHDRRIVGARAAGAEIGARDPFPQEIESNFADKVLGHGDTEHVILVPNSPALSLAQRSCVFPVPPGTSPFSLDEAKALLRKIVGWRLAEEQSGLKLQCEWKLKDHAAGLELLSRLSKVTDAELELNLDEETHILRAELWTESIGGLCENDFILAARIDQVKTSDLIKRTRFWA